MAAQVATSMAQLSLNKSSRFPPRPKAEAKKGTKVDLIVNLFRLTYNTKCPLRKYHLSIVPPPDWGKSSTPDASDTKKKGSYGKPSKSGESAAAPEVQLSDTQITKKIPLAIRRHLIMEALKKINKGGKLGGGPANKFGPNNFVYDGIATIYTIVDLFGPNASKTSNWLETEAIYEGTSHSGEKEINKFTVKIGYQRLDGTNINLGTLDAYCQGKALSIEDVQPAIQALNVMLNYNLIASGRYVNIGSNMFEPKPDDFYLGNGLRMNNGFYMSVRPARCGMLLNVANTAAAFYEECSLMDLLVKRVQGRMRDRVDIKTAFMEAQRDPSIWDQFEKDIRQKKVLSRHLKYPGSSGTHFREWRVDSLVRKDATQIEFMEVDFKTKTSRKTTIQNYFKTKHNYTLEYPKLFCIKVGDPKKHIHLPMEVCHLIDKQACRRKLDPKETADFIKQTATKPDVHFDKIKRNATDIRNSGKDVFQTFGLNIGAEPIPVKGRELVPTKLLGSQEIKPFDGAYNIRNIKFHMPVTVTKWLFAFCAPFRPDRDIKGENDRACQVFLKSYCEGAAALGVTLPKPHIMIIPNNNWSKELYWSREFFGFLENNQVQYALIVLPEPTPPTLYQTIKFAEASLATKLKGKFTRTQCLKFLNFKKGIGFGKPPDRTLVTNLWLKANEKLGGNNFTLKASVVPNGVFDPNNLYVGIDVSHPAPGDALCRSVVAAVGMWNITGKVGYHTVLRVQETRDESPAGQPKTIEHVDKAADMLAIIVDSFKKAHPKHIYPGHILVLRDGVSEGQFAIVHNLELNKILTYASKLSNKPKITYVVVQKRHKIRFKLARRSPQDRDDNIHPGTVVDQDIIHPTDHDFYLAPHKAIQGTSKPAHYYALHDDKGYSQDDLQEISHALCYMSPRCNRAISIPAPVYLADLAAERGRNLVIAWAFHRGSKNAQGSKENIVELNKFFSDLPSEYLNNLFYN